MNDPHVVALRYRLVLRDHYLTIDNPPPVEWQVPVCEFRLADGILTATLTGHHATVDEARSSVEPYLKAYGLHTMLMFGQASLEMQYDTADTLDRCPLVNVPDPGKRCIFQMLESRRGPARRASTTAQLA